MCNHGRSHRTYGPNVPNQARLPLSLAPTRPPALECGRTWLNGPPEARAFTAGAQGILPAADVGSTNYRLHGVVTNTDSRVSGARMNRPFQQAPGIAVRRRLRSSVVPFAEPPLQGAPRCQGSRFPPQGACIAWRVARALHPQAGLRSGPSRNPEPSAQGPREVEEMRAPFGECMRRVRAEVS